MSLKDNDRIPAEGNRLANLAIHTKTEQAKREHSVQTAFAFFNETSDQLARSYKLLEDKVHQLNIDFHAVDAERAVESKRNTELEQRMKALLDFLPGGVIVLNARGVIIESNPAANSLLESVLHGRVWRHVIADCFAPKNDDGFEVSTKAGRRLSISTSSLGVEGQIILLTDQTETRQLQEHLSRSERLSAMGKMVSALAHQIRTPLSAAMLYAGHLCDSELDSEMHARFSKKCLSRLQHMEKQVRDMMLFVKSELPLNDVITARDLERELKAAAEVAIHAGGCHSHWVNHDPNLLIKCHQEALVSSLMNLINNAIQSSDQKVKLRVCFAAVAASHNKCLRISIQDNGNGMSEETLNRVQEAFTTTKVQGTGLGLSVMRSVAKAHGAEFSLRSIEGKGSVAFVDIPIATHDKEINLTSVQTESK